MSHSVGVLSEALHSFLDLISAAVSFFTVREAGKPADEDHPFGHGKIETLSSLFESLLLSGAAGVMVYEGIDHLRHPKAIEYEGLAIGVMIVSLVVSFMTYRHNLSAAEKTDSSALHLNALHFLSDVVASFGVLVGFILLEWTEWLFLDPIIAFAVAAYILSVSGKQVKKALLELSDMQLPEEEVYQIRKILESHRDSMIEVHDLRTRRSGSTRHIDFHMVVCGQISVENSHEVCDRLEAEMNQFFPQVSVNIHVEPCEKEQTLCYKTCPHYRKK